MNYGGPVATVDEEPTLVKDDTAIPCTAMHDMWLRPGERPEVAFAIQLQCDAADLHARDLLDIEPVDIPTTGIVLARDTDEERSREDQQELVEAVAPTLTRPKRRKWTRALQHKQR